MGTNKSSESMELADYYRSQRTTTAAQVDAVAESHPALVRYEMHTCPSANTGSAH